jgi:hypothetical protein
MKKIITLASLSTLALFLTLNAQAEIYKWTDANGNIHYSAHPPAKQKVKSQDIEDRIRSAAGKYRASTKSSSEKDSEDKSGEEVKLSGPDQKLIKSCKGLRKSEGQLQKNYRNIWIDNDGKKTLLDQKQRKEKIQLIKKQIKEFCSDVKT